MKQPFICFTRISKEQYSHTIVWASSKPKGFDLVLTKQELEAVLKITLNPLLKYVIED